MRKSSDFKKIIIIICFYLLVFQNLLQQVFHPLQYLDEFLAIMIIPTFILYMVRSKDYKITKNMLILIITLITLFMVGMISSVQNQFQSIGIALNDALLIYKFFFIFFLSRLLFDEEFLDLNKRFFMKHLKFVIYIFFLLSILNIIFKLWPSDIRFGIMSNRLFFSHPTILASMCVFFIALLFLFNESDNYKSIRIGLIFSLLIMLSTLRFKSIGASFLITMIIVYVSTQKKIFSISKLAFVGAILLIIVWDQFYYYYIELDDSARNQLTVNSFKIANDYFPFGTGFATYGSHMSGIYYSPVYGMYKINKVYGMTQKNISFISDTFWPMILGQLGYCGLFLYLYAIYIIYKEIKLEFNLKNNKYYISKLIVLAYLIISSTSESAFVSPAAVPLAFIIGIKVKKYKEQEDENNIA